MEGGAEKPKQKRKYTLSPEGLAKRKESLKRRWQDPAFRERQAEAVRAELKERWQDPAFRERQAEAVRENWKDPAFRERNAEATRKAKSADLPSELPREYASLYRKLIKEVSEEKALETVGKLILKEMRAA